MPAATRLGDNCTGHGLFPARPNIAASPDVFINGKAATRVGDKWAVHCVGPSCHDSVGSNGSSTVFINGKPLIRIGDPIAVSYTHLTLPTNREV